MGPILVLLSPFIFPSPRPNSRVIQQQKLPLPSTLAGLLFPCRIVRWTTSVPSCAASRASSIAKSPTSLPSLSTIRAVAGLAIACIFVWKLLRSSPGRRARVHRKDRASSSTSQAETKDVSPASEGHLPVGPLTNVNLVQAVASAVEITCQLLGIILEEKTPEELQKHATVKLPVLPVVKEICKHCDMYLMETVLDDESEQRILSALENSGIFLSSGLIKDKVLFCSTETGRTSFVRQLEADWHVDSNLDIISQLSRFIGFQLYISQMESGQIAPNAFTSTSLEQFFS